MTNFTKLNIAIDSSSAKAAAKDLDALAGTVVRTANKIDLLRRGWEQLTKTLGGAKGMAIDAAALAARYDTLGASMVAAGRNAGHSRQEMAAYEKQLKTTGMSVLELRQSLASMATTNLNLAQSSKLAWAEQDLADTHQRGPRDFFARRRARICANHEISGVTSSIIFVNTLKTAIATTNPTTKKRMNPIIVNMLGTLRPPLSVWPSEFEHPEPRGHDTYHNRRRAAKNDFGIGIGDLARGSHFRRSLAGGGHGGVHYALGGGQRGGLRGGLHLRRVRAGGGGPECVLGGGLRGGLRGGLDGGEGDFELCAPPRLRLDMRSIFPRDFSRHFLQLGPEHKEIKKQTSHAHGPLRNTHCRRIGDQLSKGTK